MTCRHNLALDVKNNGSICVTPLEAKKVAPIQAARSVYAVTLDGQMDALAGEVVERWLAGKPTCALDVADEGELKTLEEVGSILGVTRERIRQLEAKGLRKLSGVRGVKNLLGVVRAEGWTEP